jgi:CHRD domain
MKRIASVTVALLLITATAYAWNDDGFNLVKGFLTGYEEIPTLSTPGHGRFFARINKDETEIEYALKFEELEGTVTQAHIHFGQKGTNGGIMVWLCETATNPSPTGPATPDCVPGEWITGTLDADDVLGPAAQGIQPGEFAEVLAAIRAGRAYANVHSSTRPGGEIRSQLGHANHDDHHKDHK